jgi:hypothetical protein
MVRVWKSGCPGLRARARTPGRRRADGEAARFQARTQFFVGGAGVGGAFQRQHLAGAHEGQQGVGGVEHEGQVGLAVGVQRGRHADDQGVRLAGAGEVAGGLEAAFAGAGDVGGLDVVDIAFPAVQALDLGAVDVDAEHAEARLGIAQGQGQADIAEADDADHGAALVQPLGQLLLQICRFAFVTHECPRQLG